MAPATAAPGPLSILPLLTHGHILVFILYQGQGWAVALRLPPLQNRTGWEARPGSHHQ